MPSSLLCDFQQDASDTDPRTTTRYGRGRPWLGWLVWLWSQGLDVNSACSARSALTRCSGAVIARAARSARSRSSLTRATAIHVRTSACSSRPGMARAMRSAWSRSTALVSGEVFVKADHAICLSASLRGFELNRLGASGIVRPAISASSMVRLALSGSTPASATAASARRNALALTSLTAEVTVLASWRRRRAPPASPFLAARAPAPIRARACWPVSGIIAAMRWT